MKWTRTKMLDRWESGKPYPPMNYLILYVRCDFLLVNSDMWPTSANLQQLTHQIPSDVVFDLTRSLKVNFKYARGITICFILVYNCNLRSLADMRCQNPRPLSWPRSLKVKYNDTLWSSYMTFYTCLIAAHGLPQPLDLMKYKLLNCE